MTCNLVRRFVALEKPNAIRSNQCARLGLTLAWQTTDCLSGNACSEHITHPRKLDLMLNAVPLEAFTSIEQVPGQFQTCWSSPLLPDPIKSMAAGFACMC